MVTDSAYFGWIDGVKPVVSQNLALIGLAGIVLGFIGGLVIGAYVFVPMGGWGAVLGILSPVIGMFVGNRLLMEIMAR